MLIITIHDSEVYDEKNNEFVSIKEQELRLEHSLISLAKWESKWCKPFLTDKEKTPEETIDYIKCMTLDKNVKPEVYNYLSPENVAQIKQYINAPMTATTFNDKSGKGKINNEQTTAELLYYWLVALNIPFECQKWHLNRLITLIKVCNIKNEPDKKLSGRELYSRNAALNAARRKKHRTRK